MLTPPPKKKKKQQHFFVPAFPEKKSKKLPFSLLYADFSYKMSFFSVPGPNSAGSGGFVAPGVFFFLRSDSDPDYLQPGPQTMLFFQDFVLLCEMDHLIYDYGSFGFWAAVLAGGETLVADNYSSK